MTGTNGKTTTTEWIGHIHRDRRGRRWRSRATSARRADVAGRLGLRWRCRRSCARPRRSSSRTRVAFAPEAAVLLNLTPDHLDRHGSYEDYVAAKLRIFVNQGTTTSRSAPDDLEVERPRWSARQVRFGPGPGPELSDRAGYLWWDEQPLIRVEEIALPGAHNVQNAMATAATCLAARRRTPRRSRPGCGRSPGCATGSSGSRVKDGVTYVNDSKATNVASTIVALEAFEDADPPDRRRARQAAGLHAAGAARGRALPRPCT